MKSTTLIFAAAPALLLAACASGSSESRQTARVEPRPAPITSPTARDIPPRETPRAETARAPAPVPAPRAVVTGPVPGEMNLAALIGADVKDPAGQTIGEVDNVVLDGTGRIDTVIVTVGGFFGLGGRDVALRWSDLNVRDGGRDVSVAMTKIQLQQMPEYRSMPSGTTATLGAGPDTKK